MQMLVTRKTGSLLGATACVAALIVLAAVDPAAAQKGSNFKSTPTGIIKPPPFPQVRDHRGGANKTTSSAPGGVTVGTLPPRKPPCNALDVFPASCVGSGTRDRIIDHRHRTIRDHR